MGRNGSGKSNFAEALELLLTGDTYRWAQRTKVWREGWRNLHQQPAAIEAQLSIEGEKGIGVASKRRKEDDDLDAATCATLRKAQTLTILERRRGASPRVPEGDDLHLAQACG